MTTNTRIAFRCHSEPTVFGCVRNLLFLSLLVFVFLFGVIPNPRFLGVRNLLFLSLFVFVFLFGVIPNPRFLGVRNLLFPLSLPS